MHGVTDVLYRSDSGTQYRSCQQLGCLAVPLHERLRKGSGSEDQGVITTRARFGFGAHSKTHEDRYFGNLKAARLLAARNQWLCSVRDVKHVLAKQVEANSIKPGSLPQLSLDWLPPESRYDWLAGHLPWTGKVCQVPLAPHLNIHSERLTNEVSTSWLDVVAPSVV
jgi:hypothetical protein